MSFVHCLLCTHIRGRTIKTYPLARPILYCEMPCILQGSVAKRLGSVRASTVTSLQIFRRVPWSMNFENRSTFGEIMGIKSSDTVTHFNTQRMANGSVLRHPVYVHYECLSSTSALIKEDEFCQFLVLIVYHLMHKCFQYIE